MYNLVVLCTFSMLCKYLHYPFLGLFHHPQQKLNCDENHCHFIFTLLTKYQQYIRGLYISWPQMLAVEWTLRLWLYTHSNWRIIWKVSAPVATSAWNIEPPEGEKPRPPLVPPAVPGRVFTSPCMCVWTDVQFVHEVLWGRDSDPKQPYAREPSEPSSAFYDKYGKSQHPKGIAFAALF